MPGQVFNAFYQTGDGQVTITQLTTTDVPEPTIWSLLLSGVGFTGWMLRRRRFARSV